MDDWEKKRYRPKRSSRDRALAQLRGYWEPQDTSGYEHTSESAVEKAIGNLGLQSRFDEEQVFDSWNAIVSNFVASHSRPGALQRRVLSIQVLHSTVFYELERMKGEILRKMQDRFGAEHIRDLKFRLG
ncbi:MAG: DUF721 domain-containing protein [Verrucomicrobiota bacterium]